jgi:hypothetical protein
MDYIAFTPGKLARFKRAYEACPEGGVFIFEGREVLKAYAKYVIEYVEAQLR